MATKRYYATGAFRYGTRMLTAGDPVDLDAPNARLFTALGKISDKKPRVTKYEGYSAPVAVRPAADTTAKKPPAKRKRAAKKK